MVLELLYTNDDGDPRAQETSSNAGDCSTSSSTTTTTNNNKDSKDIKNNKNSKKDEKIEETEDIVSGLPPSARGTRGRGRGRDRRVRPTTDDKALPRKNYFRTGSLASKLSDGAEDDLWTKGWEGSSGKASFRSPGATLFEGGFDDAQCRGELNANSNHGFGQRRFGNLGFWEGKLVSDFVEGKINGNHELGRKSESGLNGTNVRLIGRSSSWREDVKYQKFSGKIQNRSSIDGLRGSLVEQNFPRIRIGDVACGINGNVEASWFHLEDQIEATQQGQCTCCSIGEIKRLGQTISKGHGKYQLMLSLQLGIRFTVGKANSIKRELIPEDFDPKEKFWTRFPPQGSGTTPAHQLAEFRWKDYCPMVFRHLREILEVDSEDYMLAICENGSLRELSSPGKSGSFFYMTQDDNFMIKTLKKSEVKVLLRMLPSYYKHVYQYKNSLITKFFGVHCIKPAGGQKTRFIIMGNLFGSEYRIHRRFDLKGSSHGRMTSKPRQGIDETTTLKDLDLNFIFRLQKFWFQKLNRQIDRDCKFLESERIMDYSLLVGLHFLDCSGNKMRLSPYIVSSGNRNLYQDEVAGRCHFFGMGKKDTDMILSGRRNLIRLGGNMPARAQHVPRSILDQSSPRDGGNITPKGGKVHKVILHFGIIDILQDYDINKKLEHAYKSLQVDPTSISAVDPKLYSSRFRDFIHRIFVEDK